MAAPEKGAGEQPPREGYATATGRIVNGYTQRRGSRDHGLFSNPRARFQARCPRKKPELDDISPVPGATFRSRSDPPSTRSAQRARRYINDNIPSRISSRTGGTGASHSKINRGGQQKSCFAASGPSVRALSVRPHFRPPLAAPSAEYRAGKCELPKKPPAHL
ncbi:hypothetical protein MRX96_003703 [Rhipicephalus microplus]